MRTTRQLSNILPIEMAETVWAKVARGEYASESEVIRNSLRSLLAQDQAVETWLHGAVASDYDALKQSPSRAVTSDEVP